MIRIGIGYDVHQLVEGFPCILGGVEIPFEKGLKGYSDADVLLHAICDALLGAVGEGDLGRHFPEGDPEVEGDFQPSAFRRGRNPSFTERLSGRQY
ncbi:MAG: 2-C-methyl-D-erythritol 2,4-cyclodiphosphate synthase [Candidatus Manganitrophus sp.]|nr:2-C-methyl-D-erythritol 2,4-cyclodiphosphate synthase [Candidatus Manganitrophus sp.]